MHAKLKAKYLAYRAQGYSMQGALAAARAKAPKPMDLDWSDCRNGFRATFRKQGFDVSVTVSQDDCEDWSWIGTFTSSEGPNTYARRNPERNAHTHIKLANSLESHLKYYRNCMARGPAYERAMSHVREDLELMEQIARGDRSQFQVLVTVSRKGVELGSDSLGGCDYGDNWRTGAEEVLREHSMIANAIADARKALKALCQCKVA